MTLSIKPILPTRDDAQNRVMYKRVLDTAAAVGKPLDAQEFVTVWVSDAHRTFIAEDDGTPVGFAHMAFGRRYFDADFTASLLVLGATTPAVRQSMLLFVRDSAKLLGATELFFAAEDGDTLVSEPTPLRVHRIE
jgi:hypothetical protein